MAEPRTRRRTKIGRVRIGLNVVVQVVLILFLAAMVNSLAFKHYKRWDFSRDQKFVVTGSGDQTTRIWDLGTSECIDTVGEPGPATSSVYVAHFSPDGNRIVFDRDSQIISVRWYGGDPRIVTDGEDPAYAPNGRLAVVSDGQIVVGGRIVAEGTSPAWSPGGRLAYVRDNVIYVAEKAVHKGQQPAWQPPKRVRELLPDFDQRPPSDLTIAGGPGRWLLGFTSLVDNIGIGPSVLVGVRAPGHARMIGTQRVHLANGKVRTYRDVAQFRYTNSPPPKQFAKLSLNIVFVHFSTLMKSGSPRCRRATSPSLRCPITFIAMRFCVR